MFRRRFGNFLRAQFAAVAVIAAAALVLAPAAIAGPITVDRIAGANRYQTSALIGEAFGQANAIVIANGETSRAGIDALAANYVAGVVGGPILLVSSSGASSDVIRAIQTILVGASATHLYVIGGPDAVPGAVVDSLRTAAVEASLGEVSVTRIAGANRFETAAQVASQFGPLDTAVGLDSCSSLQTTAILTSGLVNADALAAGPLSYSWRMPVLLTSSDRLSDASRSSISSLHITQLLVLGGQDRVSNAVIAEAQEAGVIAYRRVAGADRFATAAELYSYASTALCNQLGEHYGDAAEAAFVANGAAGFADALSAGPLAGARQAPLLLVPATSTPKSVTDFLSTRDLDVTALGSTSSVPNLIGELPASAEPVDPVSESGGPSPAFGSASAICRDGTLSYSATRRGTCSHHGGVSVWL